MNNNLIFLNQNLLIDKKYLNSIPGKLYKKFDFTLYITAEFDNHFVHYHSRELLFRCPIDEFKIFFEINKLDHFTTDLNLHNYSMGNEVLDKFLLTNNVHLFDVKILNRVSIIDVDLKNHYKNFKKSVDVREENLRFEVGYGAAKWLHRFVELCFNGYEVNNTIYIDNEGCYILNFKDVLHATKYTVLRNLEKLKEYDYVSFKVCGNNITGLKFNKKKIPGNTDVLPPYFSSMLYENQVIIEKDDSLSYLNYEKLEPYWGSDILNHRGKKADKYNFIEKNLNNQLLGKRSEEIALNHEKERVSKFDSTSKISIPQIVSDDASLGYDIISVNEDGSKRYIEVKTVKKYSDLDYSFYITQNELIKSTELKNYFIYFVFLGGEKPTVRILGAKSLDDSNCFEFKATSYRVFFRTSEN